MLDIAALCTAAFTAVGGAVGYGRLTQRVSHNEQDLTNKANQETLKVVHTDITDRLKRIENKLDTMNGGSH